MHGCSGESFQWLWQVPGAGCLSSTACPVLPSEAPAAEVWPWLTRSVLPVGALLAPTAPPVFLPPLLSGQRFPGAELSLSDTWKGGRRGSLLGSLWLFG